MMPDDTTIDELSPLPLEEAIDDIIGADLDYQPPSVFPKPYPTLKDPSVYNQETTLAPLSVPNHYPPQPPRKPRQPKPNKYVDELHNEFIEGLSTSKDLKLALSVSGNPRAKTFLEELTNPRNANKSITRIARKSGVGPVELAEILRDYYASSAFMEIVKGAPQVAKDLVYDSQTIQVDCPRCGGFGENQNPKTDEWEECKRCLGTGLISKSGSSEARKLISEAVGWTKSKSGQGAHISVNIHNQSGRVESTIEELDRIIPTGNDTNPNIIDIEPE